jgi:hypothetical protein
MQVHRTAKSGLVRLFQLKTVSVLTFHLPRYMVRTRLDVCTGNVGGGLACSRHFSYDAMRCVAFVGGVSGGPRLGSILSSARMGRGAQRSLRTLFVRACVCMCVCVRVPMWVCVLGSRDT